MITSMLSYAVITLILFAHCYNAIPIWLRIILQIVLFVAVFVAYASEEKLRDKLKKLEDEVKNLKKGGECYERNERTDFKA